MKTLGSSGLKGGAFARVRAFAALPVVPSPSSRAIVAFTFTLVVMTMVMAFAPPARASLAAYDQVIVEDASGGLNPLAKQTTALVLTGANRGAFNFGAVAGDATMEFVLEGVPGANSGSYLAVGSNTGSNLRYAQWANTKQLGFTLLGVADYLFSPQVASPEQATHIAYVWNASTRTMRVFVKGVLAGISQGIDPGFSMPRGQGWLGANPDAGEAMVGTIHRVTVYGGVVAEEVINRHADAFAGVVRPPSITTFTVTPAAVFSPASATLNWSVLNASTILLDGKTVQAQSSLIVSPGATTTYTLVATNVASTVQATVTLVVNPKPLVRSFNASKLVVGEGQSTTLTWEADFARGYEISPDVGSVTSLTTNGVGAVEVRPTGSRTYTLTATNAFGADTATLDVVLANPAKHLVISEFMADDSGTLADEDGAHSGWIEVHNPTPSTVNLLGCFLTDRQSDPMLWAFPSTNVPPGGFVVVFASGKDRAVPGGPLHANFRLSNSGEFLGLLGPGPEWLHVFAPSFPRQRPDISYGILGDDPALERFLWIPTPGEPNNDTPPPPAPVVFSVSSRTFAAPFQVELSSPDIATEIRYTTNGTPPSVTNGVRYSGAVVIDRSTRLRAVAIQQGQAGGISGANYIKLASDLTNYTSSLPIMLIDDFGAGPILQKGWSGTGAGIKQVPRKAAAWMTFERTGTSSAITGQPEMASLIGIRGRGAYSSQWTQKPYSVEAMDEDGNEAKAAPLGMPAHADWVLYYPDPDLSRDPTLLFNTFAYDLSRAMGHYSVRFRWVEAFVNEDGGDLKLADRRGVYAIIEKVARGVDRLDFQRLSADGKTGSWLLNLNRMDPEPENGWPAPNGAKLPWFFHTAGPNRILQTLPNTAYGSVPGDDLPQQSNGYLNFENPNGYTINAQQRAAIEAWFKQFEDVLYNDSQWRNPTNGYRRQLDTFDFADYFLLNMLTRNGDGLLISMFPWKGDDGKLRIGPAWDYNWSAYFISGGPTGDLMYRSEQLWYPRLFADPDFAQYYVDRWWDLRAGPLANAAMEAIVDRQSADISSEKALLNGMPSKAEWGSRLAQMKTWLRQRAEWVDTQYLRPPAFSQNGGDVPPGFRLGISAATGTIYYTTDGNDPRAPGGTLAATARAYSTTIPITNAVLVQARARSGTIWSGLTHAGFAPTQDLSKLLLTEVMYNPPSAAGYSGDDLEFLEFKNTGLTSLDLSGLTMDAGVNFVFTNGTKLGPGAFFLLAKTPAAFAAVHPGAVVNGVFTGKLDNGGETLRLVSATGATLFEFAYDDSPPWPSQADGFGFSLQRADSANPANDPSAWVAALPTPGGDYAPGAPVIVQQPLSQGALAGRALTLSVAVTNTASLPITYRWLRNGAEFDGGTLTLAETQCFLQIPSPTPGYTNFSVLVRNAPCPVGTLSATATLSFLLDSDNDGMPDDWERAAGLDPLRPADAILDKDGDGVSNLDEFLSGTDPEDPLSRLKIDAIRIAADSEPTLAFRARRWKTYTVQYADELTEAVWHRLVDIPAGADDEDRTVPLPVPSAGGSAHRFYRLVTPRQ